MKVMHIGEYVNGGVATYLNSLMKVSGDSKIEHYLVLSKYKSNHDWNIDADKIMYYPYKRKLSYVLSAIKMIQTYINIVQPDIVHVHSTWAGAFVRLPYILKKRKFKIVYSPHGWAFLMENPFYKKNIYAWIERMLSRNTDGIINISKYEQEQSIIFGLPKNKMNMIYNGVIEKNTVHVDSAINCDPSKINLLFVGRLDRQKGLDIFLRVYDRILVDSIHLYVIGEGVLDNQHVQSDRKTTYLGWIKNEIIDQYYQMCDAVIMPSRWEGFGLTAVEGMRNAKPIIVSNQGALPELVKNGQNGYVFDINDEMDLESILIKLQKDELKAMGQRARKIYEEKFMADQMRIKTYHLYKKILQDI